MRFLPYVHPVWQVGALVLALWALWLGLRMRGLRRGSRRSRRDPAVRAYLVERHARFGIAFAAAIVLGYVAGPLTLGLARDEEVFRSAHAFFATLTLALVLLGAVIGLGLWRGRGDPGSRDLHAWCMGLALFLSLVTVMLGLGLLP